MANTNCMKVIFSIFRWLSPFVEIFIFQNVCDLENAGRDDVQHSQRRYSMANIPDICLTEILMFALSYNLRDIRKTNKVPKL